MTIKRVLLFPALAALGLAAVFATGQVLKSRNPAGDFKADWIFAGSSLAGWHTLGQADWKAQNGEIIGIAPAGRGGGWLLLDRSWQDIAWFSRFRCIEACKTGVLLRAEKTTDGMKGIYVSLSEGDLVAYRVTLDGSGKEISREKMPEVGQFERIAMPRTANSGRGGLGGGPAGSAGRGNVLSVPLPDLDPPKPGLWSGEWNSIEVVIDANIVRPYLNATIQVAPGNTGDDGNGFGPVALWVGPGSEVHFKDVAYRDINNRITPIEKTATRFREQKIDDFYYAWGAAVADFNHDGIPDIVSGPYVYLGPDYTVKKEIYLGRTYSPGLQFASNAVTFAYDFTGDGWPDVLATESRPMVLYVNPRGESRRWKRYEVLPGITSELVLMRDINGDGRPDVVFAGGGTLNYATYDPANPTAPWAVHRISEPGLAFAHGMGVGDINGDGRLDILQTAGWWEQPPPGNYHEPWTYHPQAFGRWGRSEGAGGAEMAVYDVNGDGKNDVVTGLNAHGWGLAWFEQKRDAAGLISFERHMIMDDYSTVNAGDVTMSEMHASAMADIDGDGIPDYITGRRHFAHLESWRDADSNAPGYLYWFRTVRNPKSPGGAEFVPEVINNRSGVGSQIAVADLNSDGAPDIVTATDRGLFIFWGTPSRHRGTAGR